MTKPQSATPIRRRIIVNISGAGESRCDDCEHLRRFSTGLINEWHMTCRIYDISGRWNEANMKRPKVCLSAERKALRRSK